MQKLISVITSTLPARRHFLLEAHESLVTQELPTGWSWEWIVQQDGKQDPRADDLVFDSRVSVDVTAVSSGAAASRNLALVRAQGSLIRNLDDDDLLMPGALANDIEILESHQDVHWTCSQAFDILADGSLKPFEQSLHFGRLECGELFEAWDPPFGMPPFLMGTLAARTETVRALGGYMALPGAEDVGLVMALSALTTGFHSPFVSYEYRKWDGQTTALPWHNESARILWHRAIAQRIDAMKLLRIT